ncbi:MAG: hypothetical protein MUC93_02110 [Bacteroidales bacterium]|jgi:uncharacterized protein (TIGR02145 family)|nr:hypothetical protein [Bacteroidales bacterium]
MKINKLIWICLIAVMAIISTCKKVEKEMLVTTGTVLNILTTSAEVSIKILDLGEGATQYGHCWSTTPGPTVSNTKTERGIPEIGDFKYSLTSLVPNTKYYIKAYISRGNNVAYGSEINFTTASADLPELTTTAVTGITQSSAVSGGNITSQGGTPVTARGVCWSTATITALTNNKTTNGSGTGSFTSEISGLSAGTTYYVRAYATNDGGTKLGNELSFPTNSDTPVPPMVTTATVTSITAISAVCGGEVTNEGSSPVTLRGVCWSTSANPTPANFKTDNGNGMGSFVSNLTGLLPGTTYYVRAFATNSGGASYAYGEEKSFPTAAVVPTISTVPITAVTSTAAKSGGAITSAGGAPILGKGVCWNTTGSPAFNDDKTDDGIGSDSYVSNLSGLAPGTKYYVKAYAKNSAGTGYGDEQIFTSADAPDVITLDPASITNTTVIYNGKVNANLGSSVITFEYEKWEYGLEGYSMSVAAVPSPVTGSAWTDVSAAVTGLISGKAYHFRIKAVNVYGTTYGDHIVFTTTVKDPDGNVYTPVTVPGGNVWMKENLKTTKYANGNPIPRKLTTVVYPDDPGYGWYNNDSTSYKDLYGALYNYGAIRNNSVCPDGWHVAADEWTTLINSLGGNAWGGKLKETGTVHWSTPNTGAANSYDFTALPGGTWNSFYNYDGIGFIGGWWTMTTDLLDKPIRVLMSYDDVVIYTPGSDATEKNFGYSVRCVRNQ